MSKALDNKEIAFLLAIGGTVGGLGTMCDGKLPLCCINAVGMLRLNSPTSKISATRSTRNETRNG